MVVGKVANDPLGLQTPVPVFCRVSVWNFC